MPHPAEIVLSVVMQHRVLDNRWGSEVWEPVEVRPDAGGAAEPTRLSGENGATRWLHHGLKLTLMLDECEGYWQNLVSPGPRVFVMWRMQDERAVPEAISASYDQASTWLDAGESMEGVAMPEALALWLGDYVKAHFHPVKKRRIRPQSFKNLEERFKPLEEPGKS